MPRLSLFPIQDQEVWKLYKLHLSSFWSTEEIDFKKDRDHYLSLNTDEQKFIQHILAFFAISDTLVNNNIAENFINNPENNLETNCFYGFQTMIENIHSETYSLQVDNIIDDRETKDKLFNAVEYFPSIAQKTNWIQRWTTKDTTFAERLLAFVVVEGIFFSASFCSIYFFKQRGLMPGLTTSNEYISRDEGLHTMFGILLFKRKNKVNRLSQSRVEEIIKSAVEMEKDFAIESLKVRIIGMNAGLLAQYIEFVADSILKNIGYKAVYNVKNPFAFMDQLNMPVKTNFFEGVVTNYQRSKDNVDMDDLF